MADRPLKTLAEAAETVRSGATAQTDYSFDFEAERMNRPPRFLAVIEDYQRDIPIDKIAEQYKCSRGTVVRYARMAGLPKRPKHLNRAVLSQTIELYRSGMPIKRIAELVGVSAAYVSTAAANAGILRRKFKSRGE